MQNPCEKMQLAWSKQSPHFSHLKVKSCSSHADARSPLHPRAAIRFFIIIHILQAKY